MGNQYDVQYLKDNLRVWMKAEGFYAIGPQLVKGYRPAHIGLNKKGQYANGEISTPDEFNSRHIRNKLRVFGKLEERDGSLVPLFIAVPKGSENEMQKIIAEMLSEKKHIKIKGF